MRRLATLTLICATLFLTAHALQHTRALQLLAGHTQSTKWKLPYLRATLKRDADSLVAIKHLRELYVYRKQTLLKIYQVALGDTPTGHKHFEGDERTPEGYYTINDKNAASSCHKNLGISYPNAADRAYAAKHHRSAGGDVKIHGLPNGQGDIGRAHLANDWTNGCIAVTDEEIDELYTHVKVGTPILILP